MKRKIEPKSKIPVISILTLAATGSEMNGAAVLQNHGTKEKIGLVHELNYPEHSFLDPQFTYSVPKDYTAYGVADLMVHTFESFFGGGKASLSDRFTEAICKEAMVYGPLAMEHPANYEYRANIMWAATNALNGLTAYGKTIGDWGTHGLGHILSFLYDTPHGATLTIASLAWMKLQKERIPHRIAKLGEQLFGTTTPDESIEKLSEFFQSIGCPVNLNDINVDKNKKEEIVDLMNKNKVNGFVHKLTNEDREQIVEFMYQ
jgi:alcohol dehydrogenase YqhD (iron-dependent ADH family)